MSIGPFAIAAIVPPLNLISLGFVGIALSSLPRWRRWGLGLTIISFVSLYALSTPFVGGMLIASLERDLPLTAPASNPPRAIVVLSAGIENGQSYEPDDDGASLDSLTLARLRATAALARRTHLPILISGGISSNGKSSLSGLMSDSLTRDFNLKAQWLEEQSCDTWENAIDSAKILHRNGINSIYLVTHAWHMPRALIAFRRAGITVTSATVIMDHVPTGNIDDFSPRLVGWQMSFYAFHEWIGYIYYRWFL